MENTSILSSLLALVANDSLSTEELELYHLIMDHREALGLPAIPLSSALNATAGRHAYDTVEKIWRADLELPSGANLHSWSDAPYFSDHRDPSVMYDAPKRAGTDYDSPGYEISAAAFTDVKAAFEGWLGSVGHRIVITNEGGWQNIEWNAIGIGVLTDQPGDLPHGGNIYHVWFGAEPDTSGAPDIKGTSDAELLKLTDFGDHASAGAGHDTVTGGASSDVVHLQDGHDLFTDTSQGGDTVFGGWGWDKISGGWGDDEFHGEAGNDLIYGGEGNDLIFGGTNYDVLYGGDGEDTIYGGDGRDTIYLNKGDDLFIDNGQGGEHGQDTVYAGYGDDTIQGGNGDDLLFGQWGNDHIWSRLGNDTVYGGTSFDVIDSGEGDDLVFGGLGRDKIRLGAGDDRFEDTDQTGELGQDTIIGGSGADVFAFGALTSEDVISDFEISEDQLELSAQLVNNLQADEVIDQLASVTDDGVLLDFTAGNTILLTGLTSTDGLQDALVIV